MPEQVFNYTGAAVNFVVPTWVTQIVVEVAGAEGRTNFLSGFAGGRGGLVFATIPVTPSETLTVVVGGQNGFNGGGAPGTILAPPDNGNPASGGGGGSDIRRTGGTVKIVVAGGGGGSGYGTPGGDGGGTVGAAGGGTGVDNGVGGSGGTQFAGGGGGAFDGQPGVVGTGGRGGNQNTPTRASGGGGGGGYFGGGGGGMVQTGSGNLSGGGGGGSGMTIAGATNVSHTLGSRFGDGYVKISWGSPQSTAPINILPSAGSTIATNTPTLGATIVAQGTARQRVEWHVATSSDFIAGLRIITEPTSKLKVSGATTEVVPLASKLFQGGWYVRARTFDEGNVASPWSVTQQFTVAHVPAASPVSPSSGQVLAYSAVGISLTWLFSDPSPDDTQTAYQAIVTDAATGVSVADTGKVNTPAKTANVVIPASKKNSSLSWKVRVWDGDNVVGAYSASTTFVVADAPGIAVAAIATVATSAPLIPFTFTPVVAPLANYRVTVTKDSDSSLVYDSGWIGV